MVKEHSDIIEVRGLTKTFDGTTAVDDISFTVQPGELFGFLGPNGAGKTTTINMLTGLARPDAGFVRIGSIDCTQRPRAAQHLIGVVPDESNLYPELTGFDNLCFCAALYGLAKRERWKRAKELLDTFGLTGAADRKFGGYSKGMKRKLTIAAGIIHKPEILFLDEPTTGLDVGSARQVRQLLAGLHRSGTTIFLTTHYIEEAQRLCDRIAFVVSGRIVQTDTLEHLLQPLQARHVVQITCVNASNEMQNKLCESFADTEFTIPEERVIRVAADNPVRVVAIVRFLEDEGIEVLEARRIWLSLEDVFVRITGLEAAVMKQEKEKSKMGGGI